MTGEAEAYDRDHTAEEEPPRLDHVLSTDRDGQPDECAIFPREASDATLTTTWITAEGDAFVDVLDQR